MKIFILLVSLFSFCVIEVSFKKIYINLFNKLILKENYLKCFTVVIMNNEAQAFVLEFFSSFKKKTLVSTTLISFALICSISQIIHNISNETFTGIIS